MSVRNMSKLIAGAVLCVAVVSMSAFADTYAYKVQYLESSGAQHIDTGVVPDRNTMFMGSYEYLGIVGAKANYDMIAACAQPRYYPVSLNSASATHALNERYVSYNDTPNQTHPYRTRHTIVFNDALHRVFVDNKYIGTFTTGFTGASHTCYLFASNNNNNKAAYHSKARIFWCEFTDTATGTVLRRFIPVVDENGKPAMFDEIESKLYYNKGTGADFTAGPQITEEPWYFVDYIESTGTQWIDTEKLALAQTRTDVGYKYTPTTQSVNAMIGGIQSPSRYYPASLQNTDAKKERYDRGSGTGSEFTLNYPVVTDHEVSFNGAERNVYVDGVDLGTFTAAFTESTLSMYMFAARNVSKSKADWLVKARIYHYEIYETNGTMCAAFRPAVDSTGKGCMYNGYTGKLHKNGGTGDFNVGRIISPEVPLNLDSRSITPSDGLNVFPFSVRPSYGTVFKLDEAYTNAFDVEVRADGVYTVTKGTASAAADVIVVTGSTAANFAVGAMPTCASIVLSGTVTLTADCDWRGLGTIIIPDGVTIDLNGHNLQTVGFKVLPNTFAMITDSTSGNGALRVEVATNEMFMNDSVPLMGSLKLVKEGAGLYLAELANQQYTGGTEVVGGTFRMKYSSGEQNKFHGQVPANTAVLVGANGTFDANGNSWGYHQYTLDGGILTSSRRTRSDAGTVSNPFTLTDDSVVSNKNLGLICQGWNEVKVRLNGHTLRYNGISGSGNAFFFAHTTFEDEGKLEIGSSWICTTNKTYSNIGRNLTVEQASQTSGGLWLEAPFTVSNIVMRGSSGAFKGSAQLTVLGTFSPLADSTNYFHNTLLADGSTMNLSDCTGHAFNCIAANGNRMTFPDNGTVTLDLSQRSDLADDMLVVAWDAIPTTTTFVLDATSAATYRAVVRTEGIRLAVKGPRDIEFAEWTGAANGIVTDPDNWTCYDFDGLVVDGALPGATTTIRVSGTTTLPYPTGVPWGRLVITGNVTLGADCDWREFGVIDIPSGVTIDLNGKTLKLSSFIGAGTVNGASGTLCIDVASGKTLTNSTLVLAGGIALVKDGAGTFVATKQQQAYTGDTTIMNGILKAGAAGDTLPLGADGSTFTVNEGATFDFNGKYNYHHYKCILAGGTLANTGGDLGTSNTRSNNSLGDITLTADSYISATKCVLLSSGGTVNLGGHALEVTVSSSKQLYMNGITVSNGTLRTIATPVNGDCWLQVYNGSDFKDTTLELATAAALYQVLPVKNLVNNYAGNSASGPGSFRVSGMFKPVGDAFHNVTLLDGATLDLTGRTGVLSSRSTLNIVGTHYLCAAHDAKITIDITGRTDIHNGDRVVEWEEEPELLHRWSFNGTYEDSVGDATAEPVGTVTLGATTVSTPGASTASGRITLGSHLIPTNQGPVTVELWARVDAHESWGKLFACGNADASNSIILQEQNNATDYMVGYLAYGGKTANDAAWYSFGTPEFGTMGHYALAINDVSSWKGVVWRRYTLDGTYVGGAVPNVSTAWALDKLDQSNTAIGGSWWNETGAAATFDEVRIWKGALTLADLEANAATSCDTVNPSFRTAAKFKFLSGSQRWGSKPFADGLYLDRRGFMLIVR